MNGWGWDDVLPHFRQQRTISAAQANTTARAANGGWRAARQVANPRRLIDAADQTGIPRSDDFNTGNNHGCGYFHVNQKLGRRWSSARGFLLPVMKRPNLKVIPHALADKLVLDGRRAPVSRSSREPDARPSPHDVK